VVDIRGGFVVKDSAIFELSTQKTVIKGPVFRDSWLLPFPRSFGLYS